MGKISQFIEEKLNPAFGAFADLAYVSAMSKAFNSLLPLMMIGAFASMFAGLNVAAYQEFIAATGIYDALMILNNLSLGALALFVAGSIGYQYSNRLGLKEHSVIIVFVSVFAFLIAVGYTPIEGVNYLSLGNLGSSSIFTAMIISALTVHVYKLCVDHKIYIKLPEGVPPFIETSFAGIVPATITGIILVALGGVLKNFGFANVNDLIYGIIKTPLSALSNSAPALIFLMWLPSVFWFFGIHGANATNAFLQPVLIPLAAENVAAYAAGLPLPNVLTYGTMGINIAGDLIFALYCVTSKHERFRALGKLSLLPSWFGVSEPNKFGIPLVLNAYMFVPQVIFPLLTRIIIYFATVAGLISPARGMNVWGLPFPINAFMQAGVVGVLWAVGLTVLFYILGLPFWRAYEKKVMEEEGAAMEETK